jgi:hypothetical protein
VPGASYFAVTSKARPGRILLAEQQVLSVRSTDSSTATSATSCRTSGSREALLPPRPLRTVQAPFRCIRLKHWTTSLRDTTRRGSAVRRHLLDKTRLPHWSWGQPGQYLGSAGYRNDVGGGGRTSKGHYDRADISASPPTPVG